MGKTGVFQEGKKFVAYHEGIVISSAYIHRQAEIQLEKKLGIFSDKRKKHSECNLVSLPSKFHINDRFDFLEKAVNMIADKVQPSIVISGRGGLGKTYTVKKTLTEKGLSDCTRIADEEKGIDLSNSFVFMKGFSTAKHLYRSLYNNNGAVIVLDDIDNIFRDNNAVNILKACLDSYDTRIVSWGAERKMAEDSLPASFEFTGQVIFITNLNPSEIDQAIRSRSMMIDLSMSLQETVDRMLEIVISKSFLPEYSTEIKYEAVQFIDDIKEKAKELSLRTLITVCKIRSEFPDDWRNMATYITCK